MAAAEKLDRVYLGRIPQLTQLAPDIVEAILDCRQPADLGLPSLVDAVPAKGSAQRPLLLGAATTR